MSNPYEIHDEDLPETKSAIHDLHTCQHAHKFSPEELEIFDMGEGRPATFAACLRMITIYIIHGLEIDEPGEDDVTNDLRTWAKWFDEHPEEDAKLMAVEGLSAGE